MIMCMIKNACAAEYFLSNLSISYLTNSQLPLPSDPHVLPPTKSQGGYYVNSEIEGSRKMDITANLLSQKKKNVHVTSALLCGIIIQLSVVNFFDFSFLFPCLLTFLIVLFHLKRLSGMIMVNSLHNI